MSLFGAARLIGGAVDAVVAHETAARSAATTCMTTGAQAPW